MTVQAIINKKKDMRYINHLSDFQVIINIKDKEGNIVAPPSVPWEAVFSDENCVEFKCYFDGNDYTHCIVDGNDIVCFVDNPGFSCGNLRCTFCQHIPSAEYCDGVMDLSQPLQCDIMLSKRESDDSTPITIDAYPNWVRGPQGEQGIQGPQGIKGDKGEKGDTGEKGDRGEKGDQGERGLQGVQGVKGDDGVSPTVTTSKTGKVTTIEMTDADGVHTATVNDGESVEVVQSTGTSTTSVMSQKAVSDELSERDGKVDELESKVKVIIRTPEYEIIQGVLKDSSPSSSATYSYTTPIHLHKGDIIVTSLFCSGAWAIALTDKEGTAYKVAVEGDLLDYKEYRYQAYADCYVSLCWRSATQGTNIEVKIGRNNINSILYVKNKAEHNGEIQYENNKLYLLIDEDNGKFVHIDWDFETLYEFNGNTCIWDGLSLIVTETSAVLELFFNARNADFDVIPNTAITESGVSQSDLYTSSTSIFLKKNETFAIKCKGRESSAIALFDDNGNFIEEVVKATDNKIRVYQYMAKEDCYVRGCWRDDIKPVYAIIFNNPVLEETNKTYEKIVDNVFRDAGGNYTPRLQWTDGFFDEQGNVNSSQSYQYSNPIPLKRGDIVTIKSAGNAFTAICQFVDGIYKPLFYIDTTHITEIHTFSYTLKEDGDICFCVKKIDGYSVSLYRDVKHKEFSNTTSSVGNISIIAAKEHHYNDGTLPVIEWYLLCDLETSQFYYSQDLVTKKLIFQFPNYKEYSFGIMHNGDIIAVRLAESLPWTSSESNRVNPYVMKAAEEWGIIHEVDFGNRIVKPCGWLENCGFLAMPNGETIFTEYTRISVETCNVWKIVGDAVNAENWQIKKTFQLSGESDAGLKHLHAVQNDPYTGYIYISIGDYEASSIYVSKDNGETFTSVLENNEALCRSLAMTFTPDYICYANDSSKHKFIKALRGEDGVMDLTQAEVITLPIISGANIASYGQAYVQEYNAVLVLDRQDSVSETAPMEFPLYIVELDTLTYHEVYTLKGVEHNLGFRTIYTEWYPNNGEIHLGFGVTWHTINRNKVCGNQRTSLTNGHETISNMIVKVMKDGGNFKLKMSTLYI